MKVHQHTETQREERWTKLVVVVLQHQQQQLTTKTKRRRVTTTTTSKETETNEVVVKKNVVQDMMTTTNVLTIIVSFLPVLYSVKTFPRLSKIHNTLINHDNQRTWFTTLVKKQFGSIFTSIVLNQSTKLNENIDNSTDTGNTTNTVNTINNNNNTTTNNNKEPISAKIGKALTQWQKRFLIVKILIK